MLDGSLHEHFVLRRGSLLRHEDILASENERRTSEQEATRSLSFDAHGAKKFMLDGVIVSTALESRTAEEQAAKVRPCPSRARAHMFILPVAQLPVAQHMFILHAHVDTARGAADF